MFVLTPTTNSFLTLCTGLFGFAIPPARIDDVLDVRLNLDRFQDLPLIGRLQEGLGALDRREHVGLEELHIPVEIGRAPGDLRDPEAEAEDAGV